MNISIYSVFYLYRKDPKKTSTGKKVNIRKHKIPQNRKDIRDITGERKITVTTAVTARRVATRVNSRTRNINNKIITSTVKFANLRHILYSELFMQNESQNCGTFVILFDLFYLT
jgi:hypothetical protein